MEQTDSPILNKDLILVGLEAATAEQAIRIMAENMFEKGYVKDTFANAVLHRESVYPTGIPTEVPVGMPHTDVDHCLKPGISLGILKNPVMFQTMGDPTQTVSVHLIFLLSVVNPASQVKLLHRRIDFFQQSAKMNFLATVETQDVALATLSEGLNVDELAETPTGEAGQAAAEAVHSFETTVRHPSGLHARPAAKFVQAANGFPCEITINNLENSKPPANAKSILSVLSLEISRGHRIRVQATGERAAEATQSLQNLVESNFGEDVG